MENQRGDSLRMRKERNLETIFGDGFTFPLPGGKSIVYGETGILYNFFVLLISSSQYHGKYSSEEGNLR